MLSLRVRHALGALELDVDLAVDAGRCLTIAGPSGAGKTSLLRVVAGLLWPREGRVRCGEELWLDTAAGVRVAPERRRCGYVFQDYALFDHLLVWQNVAYGLPARPRAERRRRASALLERFGIGDLADRRPRDLSGGERQRVALARALAPAPAALLLDEPLAALDPRTRTRAAGELAAALRSAAVPAILVTHDFVEGALLGDTLAVLRSGRVAQAGTAAELAASPADAFVADFSGAVVLTGYARTAVTTGLTEIQLDGGGTVFSTEPRSGPVGATVHPSEIALERPSGDGSAPPLGSAQNRLAAEVVAVTPLGAHARVALAAGQPLVADVTAAAAQALGLTAGTRVEAVWKATATRLVDL